jgi:hypothetical protein
VSLNSRMQTSSPNHALTGETCDFLFLHVLQQAVFKGQRSGEVELDLIASELDPVGFTGSRHLDPTVRMVQCEPVKLEQDDDSQLILAKVAVSYRYRQSLGPVSPQSCTSKAPFSLRPLT